MDYLQELLYGEARGSDALCPSCQNGQASIRCLDCFGTRVFCQHCATQAHCTLPFHRIERWNGRCFLKTSLYDLGFAIRLGHGGCPCPVSCPVADEWEDVMDTEETPAPDATDNLPSAYSNSTQSKIVLVHSSGVYLHRITWCTCPGAPPKHIQLFQNQLFSSSITSPKTAFTFDVLDHFYLDAMECKTAAMSFFQKLQRLSNNTALSTVPVSSGQTFIW
jgi:hypothetical protein